MIFRGGGCVYVDVSLKCPAEGAWVAVTRVSADGGVESLGYLDPGGLSRAARLLLAQSSVVGDRVVWEDFVDWAVTAGLVDWEDPRASFAEWDAVRSAVLESVVLRERPGSAAYPRESWEVARRSVVFFAEHPESGGTCSVPAAEGMPLGLVREFAAAALADLMVVSPPPNGWWPDGLSRPAAGEGS